MYNGETWLFVALFTKNEKIKKLRNEGALIYNWTIDYLQFLRLKKQDKRT